MKKRHWQKVGDKSYELEKLNMERYIQKYGGLGGYKIWDKDDILYAFYQQIELFEEFIKTHNPVLISEWEEFKGRKLKELEEEL